MNLKLKFKNITHSPCCSVYVNEQKLYTGLVTTTLEFTVSNISEQVCLEIEHWDKKPEDTKVDNNGNIIEDRSFELEEIVVDNYNFENLIWKSYFLSTDGDRYESCLFFGPNGKFIIDFTLPVLKWILENSNNNNSWQEDYMYYCKALDILQKIDD